MRSVHYLFDRISLFCGIVTPVVPMGWLQAMRWRGVSSEKSIAGIMTWIRPLMGWRTACAVSLLSALPVSPHIR